MLLRCRPSAPKRTVLKRAAGLKCKKHNPGVKENPDRELPQKQKDFVKALRIRRCSLSGRKIGGDRGAYADPVVSLVLYKDNLIKISPVN